MMRRTGSICDFAWTLAEIRPLTRVAVQTQFGLFKAATMLNRSEAFGWSFIFPGLMLRLGKDQECVNFVKWWGTRSDGRHRPWQFFRREGWSADAMERCDFAHNPNWRLRDHPRMAMILLKTRVMLALRAVATAAEGLAGMILPELVYEILPHVALMHVALDAIQLGKWDSVLCNPVKRQECISDLEIQVEELAAQLEQGVPESFTRVCNVPDTLVEAWVETPGAVDYFRSVLRRLGLDREALTFCMALPYDV